MKQLRFAILGTGFWARYQLAAWGELPGARCVALYNRTRPKAESLAAEFGVPAVYDDPEELIEREEPDFVDIITDANTHASFVELAAKHRIPVICQKPMAPTFAASERMVFLCQTAGVPPGHSRKLALANSSYVRLKWLWSAGRSVQFIGLESITSTAFPVFESQPFLKELDQFILTDMGSHLLDVARFSVWRSIFALLSNLPSPSRH